MQIIVKDSLKQAGAELGQAQVEPEIIVEVEVGLEVVVEVAPLIKGNSN